MGQIDADLLTTTKARTVTATIMPQGVLQFHARRLLAGGHIQQRLSSIFSLSVNTRIW